MGKYDGMGEIELRATIAEMEVDLLSQNELKEQMKQLQEENRRLEQQVAGGAPSSQAGDASQNTQALQQAVAYRDKQLTSANAAAVWANGQLEGFVHELQDLIVEVESLQTGTRGVKTRRSASPGNRGGTGAEGVSKSLAEMANLIGSVDASMQTLKRKLVGLDVNGRIRTLDAQLKQFKTNSEKSRGDLENLEAENRELRDRLQNGGALPRKDEVTRILSPEVIRMPSHAYHSVNSDQWPVRSVACQTPKTDDPAVWGLDDYAASTTPLSRSHTYDPVAGAGAGAGVPAASPPTFSPPYYTSPSYQSGTYTSPRISTGRASSPRVRAKGGGGLVSSAVLRRMGPNSPFRGH